MSRIRTIKPEFWTSEQVVSCTTNARLLFIGLLNFCDDAGIHPLSHKRIKMEVFPAELFSVSEIKAFIDELINAGLLNEYYVGEKGYWLVTGWHHQRIDTPTYRYPLPKKYLNPKVRYSKYIEQQLVDNSTSDPGILLDESTSTPGALQDYSTISPGCLDYVKEGKGKEGNGIKDICKVSSESLPGSGEVCELFDYWKLKMSCPRAKLDAKRKRKIESALSLGYPMEQLKQAIDGCANTPYNMGKNEQKKKYNGISLIFRDAEHIERYIQNNLTNAFVDSNDCTVSQIDKTGQGAI